MVQKNTLEQKLDLYTQQNRTHRHRKKTDSSLLGYSVVAGMAMLAPDAMAAIVHSTAGFSLTAVTSEYNPQLWDIDGIGGPDAILSVWAYTSSYNKVGFRFRQGDTYYDAPPYTNIGPLSVLAAGTDTSSLYARNLSPSNTVLATASMQNNAGGVFYGPAWSYVGYFANGSTGYIGLRFGGDTGTVGPQFAWVKIRFDATGDVSSGTEKATLNILEWAYDDTGAPIHVADTTVVPLPGTAGLMLLGMGSLGLQALRRRKQQYLAEQQQAKAETA